MEQSVIKYMYRLHKGYSNIRNILCTHDISVLVFLKTEKKKKEKIYNYVYNCIYTRR